MRSVVFVLFILFVNELFSEQVHRVYQKILNFDRGLSKNLTNPQLGGEEQLIRDIESFTDLLWEVRDKIKARNKTVIQQVQPFIPQKTPIFLSHPLDEDNLKSVFKWDEEDLDVLFHVSKHSQLLWDEIKYWYGKIVTSNEKLYFN